MDTVIEVFKWIGIVLAAGFIGYFGRYLAMQIIDKMQRKKSQTQSPPTPEPARETPPTPEIQLEQTRLKVEKKKAKAEAKKAKKAERG